jgi:DNA-directed RNA polymerase subunit alpha
LVLEIWTDGTIAPEKALGTASKVLIDHLRMVSGISEDTIMLLPKAPAAA